MTKRKDRTFKQKGGNVNMRLIAFS